MESRRRWQDWLTSFGTVIALILGGITFYFQFLRAPRELSAIVLPMTWNTNGTVTLRTIIWNDGARDEVVEAGYLVLRGMYRSRPEGNRLMFGPQVIRPGEAKSLTSVVALDRERMRQALPAAHGVRNLIIEEPVSVEFHTVDRNGRIVVSRVWVCTIWFRPDNRVQTQSRSKRTRLDLLAGKYDMPDTEELLGYEDLAR